MSGTETRGSKGVKRSLGTRENGGSTMYTRKDSDLKRGDTYVKRNVGGATFRRKTSKRKETWDKNRRTRSSVRKEDVTGSRNRKKSKVRHK